MELLIKGGRVIDPAQQIDEKLDIRIENGTIKELGKKLAAGKSCEVIDASGLIVTPGLIDMHVHLRDPGLEYKEDIVTGTRAAAAGGFTSVACMPNTSPVNDNKAVTTYIIAKAKAEGFVNVFPVGAITQGSKGEKLAEMGDLKEAGCVAVSDDGRPLCNPELMRRALEYAKGMEIPLISHAEDLDLSGDGLMNDGFTATELGLKGIPWVAEDAATARDVFLAEFTNSPIHIAHVSTKGAVRIIRDAKARGVKVTCETAPHYFTLTEDAVRGYNTNANVEFALASNGIIGLETALPLSLTLVQEKALNLQALISKLSLNPARILGLNRGTLEAGAIADLTIIDPEREWTVDAAKLASKSKNSPFLGTTMKGQAAYTIVSGKIIHKNQ
jgi:dihydroorotase